MIPKCVENGERSFMGPTLIENVFFVIAPVWSNSVSFPVTYWSTIKSLVF